MLLSCRNGTEEHMQFHRFAYDRCRRRRRVVSGCRYASLSTTPSKKRIGIGRARLAIPGRVTFLHALHWRVAVQGWRRLTRRFALPGRSTAVSALYRGQRHREGEALSEPARQEVPSRRSSGPFLLGVVLSPVRIRPAPGARPRQTPDDSRMSLLITSTRQSRARPDRSRSP